MMEKFLKVCRLPQGGAYAPGINLKGNYLNEFGFTVGDFVNVDVQQNKITITKTDVATEFAQMMSKNPALSKLIDEFDLVPA